MKLTRAERKQAFAGDLRVLRREKNPGQKAGAKLIVSESRGRKHIVDRETGATVEIPAQPRIWIIVKGWHLKQGETEWQTDVTIHDLRETNRELAGGLGGLPREAGLKTRWGKKVIHRGGKVEVVSKQVPKKGKQKENWTPETERGYGGSAGRGLDSCDSEGQYVPATAVPDATLDAFAADVQPSNLALRMGQRKQEQGLSREMKLAAEHRRTRRQRARAEPVEQPLAEAA